MSALPEEQFGPARPRVQATDRHIAARIRERRIMLGITQQQMAELVGVTYQQAHKYEAGLNRITAGRLLSIARALDVDVTFFFEGMGGKHWFEPAPQERMLLELARNFIALLSRKHQEAFSSLVRALAEPSDETHSS